MLTKGCFPVELCKSLSEVKVIQKICILANKRQCEGVQRTLNLKPILLLEGYNTVLRKWKRSSLREQKNSRPVDTFFAALSVPRFSFDRFVGGDRF